MNPIAGFVRPLKSGKIPILKKSTELDSKVSSIIEPSPIDHNDNLYKGDPEDLAGNIRLAKTITYRHGRRYGYR